MIDRRTMLGLVLCAIPAAACSRPAKAVELTVYKSPHCGCCSKWVEQMKANGLPVNVFETELVSDVAAKLRVPESARSCHTAEIDGYFVEGHVPAGDIRKLLSERPEARGIAVPGMPIGSPGMEQDEQRQPFDTLLVDLSGKATVFARHNQTPARTERG